MISNPDLSMPKIARQQLQTKLPMIERLADLPGINVISWAQFHILLGTSTILPPDWDSRRAFEERSKVRVFFGWEDVFMSSKQARIVTLEISASSPLMALSIQTIQSVEGLFKQIFLQVQVPALPVHPVSFNIVGRQDLRGWYHLNSVGNKAHYFSFLQHGSGLPEGESTCKIKVPLYELLPANSGDVNALCGTCLRGRQ